jgi:predicted flavoprotein YhiN
MYIIDLANLMLRMLNVKKFHNLYTDVPRKYNEVKSVLTNFTSLRFTQWVTRLKAMPPI